MWFRGFTFRSSRRHGQSSVEIAMVIVVVATAIGVMALYVQRGYQGYLRGNAESQGVQFNPKRQFSSSHNVGQFFQLQNVTIRSFQPSGRQPSGGDLLPTTQGGALPGRILKTRVEAHTFWEITRDTRYDHHVASTRWVDANPL